MTLHIFFSLTQLNQNCIRNLLSLITFLNRNIVSQREYVENKIRNKHKKQHKKKNIKISHFISTFWINVTYCRNLYVWRKIYVKTTNLITYHFEKPMCEHHDLRLSMNSSVHFVLLMDLMWMAFDHSFFLYVIQSTNDYKFLLWLH